MNTKIINGRSNKLTLNPICIDLNINYDYLGKPNIKQRGKELCL